METRILNTIFNKSGSKSMSTRVTLPITWLRKMGVSADDKELTVSFDGEKIIIIKGE